MFQVSAIFDSHLDTGSQIRVWEPYRSEQTYGECALLQWISKIANLSALHRWPCQKYGRAVCISSIRYTNSQKKLVDIGDSDKEEIVTSQKKKKTKKSKSLWELIWSETIVTVVFEKISTAWVWNCKMLYPFSLRFKISFCWKSTGNYLISL